MSTRTKSTIQGLVGLIVFGLAIYMVVRAFSGLKPEIIAGCITVVGSTLVVVMSRRLESPCAASQRTPGEENSGVRRFDQIFL